MKRCILVLAAGVMAFGVMTEAQAYDKKQLQAIKSGEKDCPRCDLSNADLHDLDLTNVNFAGANLEGAVLYRADLSGANLKGARFKGARLDQVDFTKVKLAGANLSKAWCNWNTKLPAGSGYKCEGVILKRDDQGYGW